MIMGGGDLQWGKVCKIFSTIADLPGEGLQWGGVCNITATPSRSDIYRALKS